jgi:hypothetical protein
MNNRLLEKQGLFKGRNSKIYFGLFFGEIEIGREIPMWVIGQR